MMLRQRLFAVVNNLPGIVVRNLLEISVVVSVDDSLPVDNFVSATRILWNGEILNVWPLFTGAFYLYSKPIAGYQSFRDGNIVDPFRASALAASGTVFWRIPAGVNRRSAIDAFSGVVRDGHDG